MFSEASFCKGYVFTGVCHSVHRGGHVWLLRGHVWLLRWSVHGFLGGGGVCGFLGGMRGFLMRYGQ